MKKILIMVVVSITVLYIGCKEQNLRLEGKDIKVDKITGTVNEQDKNTKIEFRYGLVFKDGEVLYLDPDKLDQRTMVVPKYVALKYKKLNYNRIPAGRLIWGWGVVDVYDAEIDTQWEILGSERKYIYRIENNTLYLSTDEKNWEKVEVTVVDENPPQEHGPNTCPVYMIVHLKCKFFENDYEIIGPVRDDLKYQKHKKK